MANWAIGDIHGHSEVFAALLEFIPVAEGDTVVLLGDLIDRGPDSAGVLQLIHELRNQHSTIILRGNHEAMLLDARRNRASLPFWIECGGDTTLDSYGAASFDDIHLRDLELFEGSGLYYESEDVIFVHANLDPNLDMSDQSENDLLWKFYDSPIRHRSGKLVVCGHTIQASGLPSFGNHSICIDTLPLSGRGWLTAINLEAQTFWQVDHLGRRRKDSFLSLDF